MSEGSDESNTSMMLEVVFRSKLDKLEPGLVSLRETGELTSDEKIIEKSTGSTEPVDRSGKAYRSYHSNEEGSTETSVINHDRVVHGTSNGSYQRVTVSKSDTLITKFRKSNARLYYTVKQKK